ncbi:unnamed protein product [Orchesella dallaii]|uniref:Coiled-coil protein 142 C-terminal domain-containing protein n=1 Tax=Orchesella dallaii TaxID=48710 RepID=A0ABP1PPC2_9HEXA
MVENLQTSPENNRNDALSVESPVAKEMSVSGVLAHENETYEDKSESESGTATQEESEDENDDRDVSDKSMVQIQNSMPINTSVSPVKGSQSKSESDQSAKVTSERIVQTGSSSESSIKTTPDTSLETPSLNLDSTEIKPPQKDEAKARDEAKTSMPATNIPKPKAPQSETNSSNTSLSPNKKNSVGSPKSIDGGPLNIRALPFESGINTECIQLLRQLWNVHDEALNFLNSVHVALCTLRRWLRTEDNEFEESMWDKKRLSSCVAASQGNPRRMAAGKSESDASGESKNDVRWIPLQSYVDGLKCISDSVSDIEKQCLTLSVFQSQCKLVLYAKIRHAKRQVNHDRLAILNGVSQLVTVATQVLASPSFWLTSEKSEVALCACSVFHLAETYNTSLESCWAHVEASLAAVNSSLSSTPSDADSGNEMGATTSPTKIRVLAQVKAANTNDAPLLKQSLKPLTATKLLQVIAQRRAIFIASDFTRAALGSFYENQTEVLGADKFAQFLDDENKNLSPLEKAFSKRPSLLGRAAVKESENGELRLTKSFKMKLYGYFHEVLWSLVGDSSEDLILWSLQTSIPLSLQSLETQMQLRKALMLGVHAQAGNPTPLLPAFETIGGALHSFSLMVNWDEKMREAFEITFRVKRPEHVALVTKPEPSQWSTEVGKKFGEMFSSCILLVESGNSVTNRMSLPLAERQKLTKMFGEEEPLGDEAQILFRLEATLNYFRAWTVRRAKVWLNSWAVLQFIACSQRDPAILVQMIKSKEAFLITREVLLKNENIAIRISARNRQMCADDMKKAIQNLQRVPDELLHAVGIVCRTLSLATLQTYMPDASHWRGVGKGSGLDPDRPSSYVRIFIDRVVEPVFKAAVNLVPPIVQESLGKQVIYAMCDAWLHYILQKKIKFSEWGAVQLLRDFVSLREWIRNETQLDKEARKAILQLEVLKSCEGVAYLLLRNPGDVLGVGKKSRKSRRVAPAAGDSVDSSPAASEASTAEDDIPPEMYVPNQQMWLQLRLKKTGFSSCCNF